MVISFLPYFFSETEPCEWIAGWPVFERLLTPKFLCSSSAVAPGGEISVHALNAWPLSLPVDINGYEAEHRDTMNSELRRPFPPREKVKVLNIGCGNSQLGECMLHHGFMDIVNCDYSSVVIKKSKSL